MTSRQFADDTEQCDHPLESIERRGEPDWKNGSQTIWYYGFCMKCGADVEVEYQFDGTKERDTDD
jgi:hypothetical protein